MSALEGLRPPGGWTTTVDVEPPAERPLRTNLTLAAECFDCGAELDIVRCDRFNGGLQLRATVDCTDPACSRRWTIDVSLTGHPKPRPRPPAHRTAPAPPAARPAPASAPAPETPSQDAAAKATPAAQRHLKFSAEPVLARVGDEPDAEIAERFGVTRRTVQRWRHGHSHLSTPLADRIALELGLHPTNLWPEWEAA